jgi:hypothetical protein
MFRHLTDDLFLVALAVAPFVALQAIHWLMPL